MGYIIVSNEKIVFKEYNDETIIKDSDFPKFLSCVVDFSDDLTFGRFFSLILLHKDFFDITFNHSLGGFPLKIYEQDFQKESKEKKDFYCEIYWGTDYENSYIDKTKKELAIFPGFHGIDLNPEESISLSLELTSLNDMKNVGLKLNKTFEVGCLKKKVGFKKIFEVDIVDFTLFDAIHAILNEISFHGTPEARDNFKRHLENTSEEIENSIKDGTLDMDKCKIIEEFFLEIAQEKMTKAINEDRFEDAAVHQKQIKELEKEIKKTKKELENKRQEK